MSVTGVQQQSATGANSAASSSMGNVQEVDKQEFLMLLVAQLRNQDPMKPMEDREFITQLAQFNSLEQMQMLNKTMTQASEMTVLGQMASFVGKEVEAMGKEGVVKGVVTGVTLVEGSAVLTVGDSQVDVRNVYAIKEREVATETPAPTPPVTTEPPEPATSTEPTDPATETETPEA
jgi:flagellar basal-body rod modification protein FlgD